jgi:hypothetical protein
MRDMTEATDGMPFHNGIVQWADFKLIHLHETIAN